MYVIHATPLDIYWKQYGIDQYPLHKYKNVRIRHIYFNSLLKDISLINYFIFSSRSDKEIVNLHFKNRHVARGVILPHIWQRSLLATYQNWQKCLLYFDRQYAYLQIYFCYRPVQKTFFLPFTQINTTNQFIHISCSSTICHYVWLIGGWFTLHWFNIKCELLLMTSLNWCLKKKYNKWFSFLSLHLNTLRKSVKSGCLFPDICCSLFTRIASLWISVFPDLSKQEDNHYPPPILCKALIYSMFW